MPTTDDILTSASWALLALGIAGLVWFAIGDRSKGRRRCPKCWYDLRASDAMQCPECGRAQKHEKRFFRSRRPKRIIVFAASLLFCAYGVRTGIEMLRNGWIQSLPTPALLFIMHFVDRPDAALVDSYTAYLQNQQPSTQMLQPGLVRVFPQRQTNIMITQPLPGSTDFSDPSMVEFFYNSGPSPDAATQEAIEFAVQEMQATVLPVPTPLVMNQQYVMNQQITSILGARVTPPLVKPPISVSEELWYELYVRRLDAGLLSDLDLWFLIEPNRSLRIERALKEEYGARLYVIQQFEGEPFRVAVECTRDRPGLSSGVVTSGYTRLRDLAIEELGAAEAFVIRATLFNGDTPIATSERFTTADRIHTGAHSVPLWGGFLFEFEVFQKDMWRDGVWRIVIEPEMSDEILRVYRIGRHWDGRVELPIERAEDADWIVYKDFREHVLHTVSKE